MLKKLLKYDLKWSYKPLIVFYILAIFFSIITRIVESFEKTLIVLVIDKICSSIVIAMIISIVINCLMRNWARFIKNIYKDESYLTHTLPVSKNTIFLSKVLCGIITLLTSFIVIIICISIVCLNDNSWMELKNFLEQSAIALDSSVFGLIMVFVATVFFEFLFLLMSGILGITIGYRSNNLKIVISIISGYGIYMILSASSLLILYIAGLLNPDIMTIFNNVEIGSSAMKSLMMIGTFLYVIYTILTYFISNKLLNKGVNVD